MEVQVLKSDYKFDCYVNKKRWLSYHKHLTEVLSFKPQSVLIVGVGDKIVGDILKKQGIKVTTVDFDRSLKADYTLDVRNVHQLNKTFDVVLCSQVLEHLPFCDFQDTIDKLMSITNHLVLTLPIQHFRMLTFFKIQRLLFNRILYSVPRHTKQFEFDGQHYWELNTKGYSQRKITKLIMNKYMVTRNYTLMDNDYHHFFIINN